MALAGGSASRIDQIAESTCDVLDSREQEELCLHIIRAKSSGCQFDVLSFLCDGLDGTGGCDRQALLCASCGCVCCVCAQCKQ